MVEFYCNLCRFVARSIIHAVLSQNLCHNLRVFMWRKIEPKSTFMEKKLQLSGLGQGALNLSISRCVSEISQEDFRSFGDVDTS